MGMFSWNCKGCGDELCCPEYVRIDDHVGTYNGYGVVVMDDGKRWDVFDRDNPNETFTRSPNAWHQLCWRDAFHVAERNRVVLGVHRVSARSFEDDTAPSERAENQGFGAPQHKFMPPNALKTEAWWKAEFWSFWNNEGEEAEG